MTKTNHVVMGNNSFRCLNCGDEYVLAMPASINTIAGAAKGYVQDHARCKPSPAGKARFEFKTPDEWLKSWDTGLSSMTIHCFMTSGRHSAAAFRSDVPHDPADFGRCYRLLKAFPAWRDRMPAMGEALPAWRAFAEEWPVLEHLHESGQASKLYDAIQSCIARGR